MTQPHPAAVPPGGDLKPAEGLDTHGIGLEALHVAEHDARTTFA
jgi:hypothetical protein